MLAVLGDVPPSEFIPVAERSDLIGTVTLALLGKALYALQQAGPEVRVSSRDLSSPDTISAIVDALGRSYISPRRLTI
jgi:predicted signal transduction protein with EAL and GGDEF domain